MKSQVIFYRETTTAAWYVTAPCDNMGVKAGDYTLTCYRNNVRYMTVKAGDSSLLCAIGDLFLERKG